jgi:hypothetical protein
LVPPLPLLTAHCAARHCATPTRHEAATHDDHGGGNARVGLFGTALGGDAAAAAADGNGHGHTDGAKPPPPAVDADARDLQWNREVHSIP